MDNTPPDELDKRLLDITNSAKEHPSGSKKRRVALTKLVEEINRQSNRLVRPHSSRYPGNLRTEIFYLALQKLLFFIYHPDKNIEGYNPALATVIVWLNVKLDRRFFREAYNELLGVKVVAGQFIEIPKISDLDILENVLSQSEETLVSESDRIRKCIEKDPEGIFRNEYISNNLQANFKVIALKRLSGKSWKEISVELDIKSFSTTSSFYYRCVKRFAPNIKAYLQSDA